MAYLPYSRTEEALSRLGTSFRERAAQSTAGAERGIQHRLALANLGLEQSKVEGANRLGIVEALHKRQTAAEASEEKRAQIGREAEKERRTAEYREKDLGIKEMQYEPFSMRSEHEAFVKANNISPEEAQKTADIMRDTYGPLWETVVQRKDSGKLLDMANETAKNAMEVDRILNKPPTQRTADDRRKAYEDLLTRRDSSSQMIAKLTALSQEENPEEALKSKDYAALLMMRQFAGGKYDPDLAKTAISDLDDTRKWAQQQLFRLDQEEKGILFDPAVEKYYVVENGEKRYVRPKQETALTTPDIGR